MTQKDTYDFEAKRQYRKLLRKFVLKHYPKGSKRRNFYVACLPGKEALELTEVYFPLDIKPDRIWGIERNSEDFEALQATLRDAGIQYTLHGKAKGGTRRGINLYFGDALDFFSQPGQQFNIVNLDLQSQFGGPEIDMITAISHNSRLKESSILCTNFFGSREKEATQGSYRQDTEILSGQPIIELLDNNTEGSEKERIVKEMKAKFLDQVVDGQSLGLDDARDKAISSRLMFLTSSNTLEETTETLQDQMIHLIKKLDLPFSIEDVRRDAIKYKNFIIFVDRVNTMMEQITLNDAFPHMEPEKIKVPKLYLEASRLKRPSYITDFIKGRYVSDNGSPMLFDFLKLTLRRDLFTPPRMIIEDVIKTRKLVFPLGWEEYLKVNKQLVELSNQEIRYLNSEREELRIESKNEQIRKDLIKGKPENLILAKYKISAHQLAGHKATLSRINGSVENGNGNRKIKNKLYQPTEQEEREILDLLKSGASNEQVKEKYPLLSKMQIAAKKAKLTRQLGNNGRGKNNENGKSVPPEIRRRILERDRYTCVYPGCGTTDEQNRQTSGHGLHVHHIDYNHENNNERNLASLCTPDHAKTNTVQNADEMRTTLEALMSEKYGQNNPKSGKLIKKILGGLANLLK